MGVPDRTAGLPFSADRQAKRGSLKGDKVKVSARNFSSITWWG